MKRWHVIETMVNARGARFGAELGVFTGATLFHLLDHCPGLSMVGVDRWTDDADNPQIAQHDMAELYQTVCDRALEYGDRANIVRDDTVAAAARFADASLDFVFVDAAHDTESVLADIRAWAPKVKPGGFIVGHDIDWPSVRAAVDTLAVNWLRVPDDVWMAERNQVMVNEGLLESLAAEPYEPRGILNSEMAMIIGTCRKMGIDLVLESGRARGQSTYLLAKYLPNATIRSLERTRDSDARFAEERLRSFANVELVYADAREVLEYYIKGGAGRRIAVLLDGPKGQAALDLMGECFKHPNVIVGFIHDMRALDHGEPSPYRIEAERRFPSARFSDDPAYVELTKHLDANIGEDTGWKPYHARKHNAEGSPFEPTGSYGPTIGVFLNEPKVVADAAEARSGGEVAVFPISRR